MSMNECIECKSTTPAGSEVIDFDVRIACCLALAPKKQSILRVLSGTSFVFVLGKINR